MSFKLKDVDLVKQKEIPKTIKVLKALYQGHIVQLGDFSVMLAKTVDSSETPFVVCEPKLGVESHIIGAGEWTLRDFIRMCNKLSDKELTTIAMSCDLNKINKTGAFCTRGTND